MARTKIKFCGLTRPTDAAEAARLGADYAGVIFAPGRRTVTLPQARQVLDAASGTKRVGIVGRERIAAVLHLALEADLDVLQLHGNFTTDEHRQIRDEFEGEIWSVMPIDATSGAMTLDWKELADCSDGLVLDTIAGGQTGGTGRTFDWSLAAPEIVAARANIPLVVAGGLTPKNVAQAIAILRPATVDVSSGVEISPGVKDHMLMSTFAEAVLAASIV
ncbi:MAG: phosphoribosylanthranilate isomerase [Gemmatimonadaceae bacterium]